MPTDVKPPTVEVVVFTYNHEAFVERALISVMTQHAGFSFNIRIHDDASTDGTVSKIRETLASTNVRWELVQAPTNRYVEGTSFYHEFIADSAADFVAILDGDDYWIDDNKLNDQVELLLEHPTAALCHHPVFEVADGEVRPVDWPPADFRDELMPGVRLSVHNVISSSSVVVRTTMFPKLMPEGYNKLGIGDYPMWALASAGHDIAFLDRAMTAYRVHETNIYASLDVETRFDRELEARIYICNNVPEEFRSTWRLRMVDAIKYHAIAAELNAARSELEARTDELDAALHALDSARLEKIHILNSTSWKITAPLRVLLRSSRGKRS